MRLWPISTVAPGRVAASSAQGPGSTADNWLAETEGGEIAMVTFGVDERVQHLSEAAELAQMSLAEVVLPTERQLQGNGLPLHLLDWGTPGQPPVLFLHGGSLTAHTWDLVCLALRQRYHCQALDLRGHGDSGWSPDADYSLEAHC